MNNKIPLKKFAEVFAQEINISEAEAEFFIKQLFETISAELREGNKVSVKGLGTFSISESGPEPVEFVPDDTLAEEVNAPFSIFSPVPLEQGVTKEVLDEVETPVLPDLKPEVSEVYDPITETEEVEKSVEEISQVTLAIETQLPTIDEPENPHPETFATEDNSIKTEIETKTEPELVESPITKIVDETSAANSDESEQPVEKPIQEWEYEEEEYVEQPQPQSSKFGSGFIIGLIVGLAIGALVLCAYIMYFVNAQPSNSSVETELTETQISDIQ
ncbi:MAG: HU family DNA-binding protein [Paramuribaculum sp.]|nr:HU family DNA-binding protein [Paramuribaculum sp.]